MSGSQKLILNKDVEGLGGRGDIISVKTGYARNYLLPQGIATAWSKGLEVATVKIREDRKAHVEKAVQTAEALKESLAEGILSIEKATTKSGGLYGAISAKDISELLKEKIHVDVEPKAILLEEHIKKIGNYLIKIRLHSGVEAEIKLQVKSNAID